MSTDVVTVPQPLTTSLQTVTEGDLGNTAERGLSDEDLVVVNTVWFWLVGVIGGVLCVVGVVGNALSAVVWGSAELCTTSASMFFFTLSLYDFFFVLGLLAVSVTHELVVRFTDSMLPSVRFFSPAYVVFAPFLGSMMLAAVYCTLCLTVDRCLAVCRPLTWPQVCTARGVYVTQALILAWAVLVNVPVAMEVTWEWTEIPELNTTCLVSRETPYSATYFHQHIYLLYIYPAVSFLIPVMVIIVCNFILVVKVQTRKSVTDFLHTTVQASRSRDAVRLTQQVVWISLLTLASRCLNATDYIWMATKGVLIINDCSLPCACISAVSKLVITFNSSINLFLYLYFARKFRLHFSKRFPRLCRLYRRLSSSAGEPREPPTAPAMSTWHLFNLSLSRTSISSISDPVIIPPVNTVQLTKCDLKF